MLTCGSRRRTRGYGKLSQEQYLTVQIVKDIPLRWAVSGILLDSAHCQVLSLT